MSQPLASASIKHPWTEIIKHVSRSTQLSRKLNLLINIKMPSFVGIFTFINKINTQHLVVLKQ